MLTSLTLDYGITTISPNATYLPSCFQGLSLLRALSVSSSDLSVVGPIDGINWSAMSSLQSLTLASVALIGNLPSTWPASLTTLRISYMNATSSLSSLTWSNTSLTYLQLSNVSGITIGSSPGNAIPTAIKTLIITLAKGSIYYPLSILPLQSYTQLQSLTLQGFLAGPLTSNFQALPTITKMDLGYNSINGTLDAIDWGTMPKLTYVSINFNSLTAFGSAFNNTPSMQTLYMLNNTNITGTFSPYLLNSATFTRL